MTLHPAQLFHAHLLDVFLEHSFRHYETSSVCLSHSEPECPDPDCDGEYDLLEEATPPDLGSLAPLAAEAWLRASADDLGDPDHSLVQWVTHALLDLLVSPRRAQLYAHVIPLLSTHPSDERLLLALESSLSSWHASTLYVEAAFSAPGAVLVVPSWGSTPVALLPLTPTLVSETAARVVSRFA